MTWLVILKYVLQFAAYVAKMSERRDIEKAVLNEVENIHGKRVDKAVAAHDDVIGGRVPVDPDDPYRRD